MTVTRAESPAEGPRLARGATPGDIRAALLAEDRDAFDTDYATALDGARASLDLTELFDTLERWRRVAVLHRDPAVFHRVARRAAELRTGEPVPDDEPLSVTRDRAGI